MEKNSWKVRKIIRKLMEVKTVEDEYSLTYGKYSRSLARRYSYNLRLKLVKKVLEITNSEIILDIGSATGDYSIDLKENGFKVVCVDINYKYLKIAKKKDRNLPVVMADACTLPFKDCSFDAVTILNALRYFNNPLLALKECNRVLKNGGSLILICHNKFCPDTFLTKKGGAKYLSLREIERLLKESNFKIVNKDMLFIPPPFIPRFLLNIVTGLGWKLNKTFFKNIFPEIFIHAIKEGHNR